MRWPADQLEMKQLFEQDGFVVLRQFLDADEMARVQHRFAHYLAEIVPALPPMDAFYADKQNPQSITMLPRMNHHDTFFQEMLTGPRFQSVAEFIWGCSAVGRDVAFFDKPARSEHATPPHQDGYYFHLTPCEAITFWLALEKVDEENGCVRYIRGSNHRGMRPHGRTEVLGFSQGVLDYGEQDRAAEVCACVEPGDLILHDGLTLHRAEPNRSDRNRRALGFVYFSERAKVDHVASRAYQEKLERELKATGRI